MDSFYILLRVNDYVVRALIDTGATSSVMSATMAAKLGLTDIIDTRRQSECKGIGKATILGYIFDADIQVYDGVKLLEMSPLLFNVHLQVIDSDTLDTILLGVDFLDNVDADIKVRERKISIFGKEFAFMAKHDFAEPMLYTDLVKTQFSSMVKKNDSDILTSIL
jgi:predicted aspartyl protease